MNFYDVIENRQSIKSFTNTPIDHNKLNRMVNAAMMSPSWKNKSSYKFILVDDNAKKQQLAGTIINETNDAGNAVKNAPLVAVVVADPNASGVVGDRQYYLVDSAIALEHFVLAATAEGYGTCWIASIDEDSIRNILSIPREYRVVAITPVGETKEHRTHEAAKEVRDYVYVNSFNDSYDSNNLIQ